MNTSLCFYQTIILYKEVKFNGYKLKIAEDFSTAIFILSVVSHSAFTYGIHFEELPEGTYYLPEEAHKARTVTHMTAGDIVGLVIRVVSVVVTAVVSAVITAVVTDDYLAFKRSTAIDAISCHLTVTSSNRLEVNSPSTAVVACAFDFL